MAGEIQIDSVTALTASGSNIVLNNVNTATNRTNLGLGSIATQASDSVSISGGNITGGTIGSGVVFPTFVGMIASFAMSSAPTGWIVCNGAPYAIADYGDLYTAIGTTWGALTNGSGGAGSTHFRVPDLRGAFLRGTGDQPLIANGGAGQMANGSAFSGPSVGSFEDDQIQDMRAFTDGSGDGITLYSSAGDYSTYNVPWISVGGGNWAADGFIENGKGTPRVGDETRPFNAVINYCIKY